MKTTLIALAVGAAAVLSSASASQETPRFSNSDYVNAARCLTYANLRVLQDDRPDVAGLAQAFDDQTEGRSYDVIQQSRAAAQRILVDATHATSDRQIERLRDRRDRICARVMG